MQPVIGNYSILSHIGHSHLERLFMAISSTSGITFESINNSISQLTTARENDLQNTINNLGDNPSTGDLLNLQAQVQQWTMFTQIESTIVKDVSDAMKGVIQKAS